MNEFLIDDFNDRFESDKREIYDYEYIKPINIETDIKQKNIQVLKDDIFIYATRVDAVLDDNSWVFGSRPGLQNMLNFLKLAVDSYNLNVLRTVWNYGIEPYFKYYPWNSRDILLFVADLIYENRNDKMLDFFLNKINTDENFILIKVNEKRNPYSLKKRYKSYGNFLDIAVYCGNIHAIKLLLPKQPALANTFEAFIEKDYLNNIKNMRFCNGFIGSGFYDNPYDENTLYSDNATFYAFDNGKIETLELLIENGYSIDFSAFDFSYQIATYANKATINYLIKNYKEEMKRLDIKAILKASNYPLLRFMIKNGYELKVEDFDILFEFEHFFEMDFSIDDFKKTKHVNIIKCITEFVKHNIKITNIDMALKYALNIKEESFFDLVISLYDKQELDLTPILSNHYISNDTIKYLAGKLKLYCDANFNQYRIYPLRVRDFQHYLKYIDFKINSTSTISTLAENILNLNTVTGVKLLLKNNFITSENYSSAVDYIISNNLDKLITTMISYSNNLGGVKKHYGI